MSGLRGKTAIAIASGIALLLTAGVPVAFATSGITSISPNPINEGQATTITVNVDVQSTCPSGDSYQGDVQVTDPGGTSYNVQLGTDTPCGSSFTLVYPTAFSGASTSTCGTYAVSAGASVNSGQYELGFTVQYFSVNCPNSAPEFPLGLALLFALAVPALLVLRKRASSFRPL